MSRAGKWVLSMLLWTWGGAAYFLLEVVYKTITGHPEHISWTMLVLAMVLCIPIERCAALIYYSSHSKTSNAIYQLKYHHIPTRTRIYPRSRRLSVPLW